MNLARKVLFPLRLDISQLESLENLVKRKKFKDVTKALRECANIGAQVIEYQDMMKDETKSAEFIQKMNDMIKNEDFEQFAHTLDSQQIDGFLYLLKLEKDNRYKIKPLL